MTKRIIFDCERMKYENTGLYHYCLNLGNHLIPLADSAHEQLDLYLPPGNKKLFPQHNHFITQRGLHKIRMPSLRNHAIWHSTYQDSYYLPFRNSKIKVVLSVHDLNFIYDTAKPDWKKQKYLRRLQMLVSRADVIVCISEYCRKDLLFYCDTAGKPVHVIHNGTNTLTEPQLLNRSYLPKKPFIFSLGTVVPKKNFHCLLPLLVNQPNMELVIAGRIDDVAYYQSILDKAERMGILKKLKIVGPISESEKSWYFNNCMAFAFPSTAEGFGLPVTEAMSVGKPLFLSCNTALPEIGGNVAFYFENFSADHMTETFMTGMKQYTTFRMQEKIIEKGRAYCWDAAAKEYWNIYRSLY
jgi:glycosyltransferase involved in cell wall biosynthesis